jgi:hypothetical protein
MTVPIATVWALGVGWGALLSVPVVRLARRDETARRVTALARREGSSTTRRRAPLSAWWRAHADDVGVRVVSSLWRRRQARRGTNAWRSDLPVVLDLLGVAVGAGCTPFLAVEVAAAWAPQPAAGAFADVLRSCALGLDFEHALDALAASTPMLRPLTEVLVASARLGVPVGPALARLADEQRRSLRRAAEAHARRIPVRLLFPLVFLVLPSFVLLTVVPGVAAGLGRL